MYTVFSIRYISDSDISWIQLCKNILKLVLRLDIRTRTDTVHYMPNTLKIEDIHKTKNFSFLMLDLWKMPCNIWTVFQYQIDSVLHQANWGFRCTIKLTGYGDQSLKIDGTKQWNNMDVNMKTYRKGICLRRNLRANYISKCRCEMNQLIANWISCLYVWFALCVAFIIILMNATRSAVHFKYSPNAETKMAMSSYCNSKEKAK